MTTTRMMDVWEYIPNVKYPKKPISLYRDKKSIGHKTQGGVGLVAKLRGEGRSRSHFTVHTTHIIRTIR